MAVKPDPLYLEIGKRIKARRKALGGMKQEHAAMQMGISRGSLANIETGRQKILVHQLYHYATVLGLQPTDLLPSQEAPASSAPADLPMTDKVKLNKLQRTQVARLLH